jgi:acyl-CoA synthetase (AMP-forming)/AMP-acid ligase II
MATSGSTGVPRFVKISHGNLQANTEAIIRSQELLEDDRAMLILPIYYCFGASVLHTHLCRGGGVVFDRRFMFPDKVLQAMDQFGCTTFAGVPTAYQVLRRHLCRYVDGRRETCAAKTPEETGRRSAPPPARRKPLACLRRWLQAGGPLAPPVIQDIRHALPGVRFLVMYGQTEATARISCLDPDRIDEKAGSAGRALDNLAVRIVDEQGNDLPAGQAGELWVKGPSISGGYLNDPQETERVFNGGWLRTRDVASMDKEGYLWIQGRLGAFAKMRGHRVSFAEAETRVAAIPGVLECAAMAVADPEAGEALAFLVVPEPGAELAPEQVRRHLPAHWACASVRFVAGLPKNGHGKLARAALAIEAG